MALDTESVETAPAPAAHMFDTAARPEASTPARLTAFVPVASVLVRVVQLLLW